MTESERRALAVLTLAYLAVGVGFAIFLDWIAGATTFPLFFLSSLLAVTLVGLLGWGFSRRRLVGAATLTAVLALVALRFVELTPVKPFREFHRRLAPGMSQSEVLIVLARSFPPDGRYAVPIAHDSPEAEHLSFALDPTDGRYDSEFVSLAFDEGKLRSAEYLPD